MCNRYSLSKREELEAYARDVFDVEYPLERPRWNVAPNQIVPIIVKDEAGKNVATVAQWNFIPTDRTGAGTAKLMTNARSEGILTTRSYRNAIQERRCIIPADGYYEFQHITGIKRPLPWLFERQGARPFVFAGIWQRGSDKWPLSFAMLTSEPNVVVAPIHNRMPVLLTDEAAHLWLKPGALTPETLAPFVAPFPPELMQTHRVNPAINNWRNDTAEAAAPAKEDENSGAPQRGKSADSDQAELF